jgi:ketosteroid isomerase-like protein
MRTLPVVDRMTDAINRHDLDALTACFAPVYASTFPAHPARSFTGRDQVRRNWETIFATGSTSGA